MILSPFDLYIYNVLGLSESNLYEMKRTILDHEKKLIFYLFSSRFRFRAHVPDPVFNIFKLVLIDIYIYMFFSLISFILKTKTTLT